MIFGYRVEDQVEKHGLWRNFDGTWNPVFDQLITVANLMH